VLAELKHDFSHPWLTVAMTLFVVAIVLLLLVIRDQRAGHQGAFTARGIRPQTTVCQPG